MALQQLYENVPNFIPLYYEEDGAHPSPNYSSRGSFYGLSGIPLVQFGGYISVVGGGGDMYPTYLGKYNMLVDDNSPLSIIQTVNVAGGNIIMQANVTVTDEITTSNNKILFMTSHNHNPEYFCTVGSYSEQAFGLTAEGESNIYENIIPIDPEWDMEAIKVVVIVQSWGNKHILQASSAPISLENLLILNTNLNSISDDDDNDGLLNPGESAVLNITMENSSLALSAENITATISTDAPIDILESEFDFGELLGNGESENLNIPIDINTDIELGDVVFNVLINAEYTDTYGDDYEYEVNFPIEVNIGLNQANWPVTIGSQIGSSPAIIDIDGDGEKEVIFGDYSGLLHVLDSNGNSKEGFPFDTGDDIWGSPAIGDIDNDGDIEIVITSKDKHLYVLNADGSVDLSYNANQFLMGSPVLCEMDGDSEMEIVFSGYTSTGDVFAINPDGSDVPGFPVSLNEKVLRGAAVADLNDNGLDDIVVATETQDMLCIVWDNGEIDTLLTAQDKFKSAPTIITTPLGETLILAGSNDHNLYGVDAEGNIKFIYITQYDVTVSPAVVDIDGSTIGIFFGGQDGYLYGINQNGENLPGWPLGIGGQFSTSPVIGDLDGDGFPEIITGNSLGDLLAFHVDGSPFEYFPIEYITGISGSPTLTDLDGDNDLEIFIGVTDIIAGIDIKTEGTITDYWSDYRGNLHRTGVYNSTYSGDCGAPTLGDLDCDGSVDITDIVNVVNFILDYSTPDPFEAWAADFNEDGNIDIFDIILIVNTILG